MSKKIIDTDAQKNIKIDTPAGDVYSGKVPPKAPDTTSELVEKIVKEKQKNK